MEFPSVIDPASDQVPLFEFWRPTRDWIGACLFRMAEKGARAKVIREGDPQRGTVMILLTAKGGRCQSYTQMRGADGHVFWMLADPANQKGAIEEAERNAVRNDPDLWVVAIDDSNGRSGMASASPSYGDALTSKSRPRERQSQNNTR